MSKLSNQELQQIAMSTYPESIQEMAHELLELRELNKGKRLLAKYSALKSRLEAAERVVETVRLVYVESDNYSDIQVGRALHAYDALKEGEV